MVRFKLIVTVTINGVLACLTIYPDMHSRIEHAAKHFFIINVNIKHFELRVLQQDRAVAM